MSIYVIGDLHLPFGVNKPMDIFGDGWQDYTQKIKEDWNKKVKKEDTVIIAGDFSWATYLEETYKDFEYLCALPGNKIMLLVDNSYFYEKIFERK